MPRSRRANKSSKIKVDFRGVEVRKLVPEGDFRIRPIEITQEMGPSRKAYLKWEFLVVSGAMKNAHLYYNTSLQKQALWNLRGVLEALGQEVSDESVEELDLKGIIDSEPECGCTVEHESYEGRKKAQIVDIFDAANLEEEGEDMGKSSELTAEDIMDMDEDELAEVVEQHDLDVKLKKIKKLKDQRKAVAEAFGEKNGGEEEEEEGEAPNVDEMDEEELQALVEEKELDVDLDDFKTLKKKRAAVSEALESAGDSEDEDDDKKKVSEDDINGMDEEELAEFCNENDLEVDFDDFKTLKKKRAAVLEAAQENDLVE